MGEFARSCKGCDKPLPPKHLRTQFAQPDSPWQQVRVHDLSCLIDFLEREESTLEAGNDGEVFKVTARAHVRGSGSPGP